MPGPGGFGPGFGPGRGFGGFGPRFGPGPLGHLLGAVATGAVVAAAFAPPPRRYPPPRAGYVYVVPSEGDAPKAVRAEEAPFLIKRIEVLSYRQGQRGEILFEIQVTINDGYKYKVLRRYSQFDEMRVRVEPIVRVVTPPFPAKFGLRSRFVGLQAEDLEQRRIMLQSWLQSLCTAATRNNPALRLPIYDFLETALYYPPDPEAAEAANSGQQSSTTSNSKAPSSSVPYATATPYAQTIGGTPVEAYPTLPPEAPSSSKGDSNDWAIPAESREASDTKLAMVGPDSSGKLEPSKAADALKEGSGASAEDLRAVWDLSDIDKDGKLDRDEFAVAWYLAHEAAAGNKPPASLPANIVPPSKRSVTPRSPVNPF